MLLTHKLYSSIRQKVGRLAEIAKLLWKMRRQPCQQGWHKVGEVGGISANLEKGWRQIGGRLAEASTTGKGRLDTGISANLPTCQPILYR
jgi:hypothetical protein